MLNHPATHPGQKAGERGVTAFFVRIVIGGVPGFMFCIVLASSGRSEKNGKENV
jgi:hypothetical protein